MFRGKHGFMLVLLLLVFTPRPQFQIAETQTELVGGEVEIINMSGAFDGYNLFVVVKEEIETRDRQYMMMIVDMDGNVVLQEDIFAEIFIADYPAEFIAPRTILVATNESASIFNMTDGSMTPLPFVGHHEYEYNPVNDTFFTLQYSKETRGSITYLVDRIGEFNRLGEMVWSFDLSSIVDYSMWCPFQEYFATYPDVSHANSIYYDVEEDSIYLLARNVNTFWKINHSTGDIIWGLGEYGNFSMYNKYRRPTDNLFYHAHAVEKVDDNTFILFDNDYHNQTEGEDQNSRILEITIDEDTMTANTSWVWQPDRTYSSHIWGDADRTPTGNRIGVFGMTERGSSDYGGRIVEVNEDQEIVWELSFISNETYRYGIYRNERFQYHPFIQIIDVKHTSNQGEIMIDWQTAFNYRPKRDIIGSYKLHVDQELVKEDEVVFDRYWRPTSFSHTIQNLTLGVHNVTFVVWDGYGHAAIISIEVDMKPLSLFQIGIIFTMTWIGVIALVVMWRLKFQR